MAKEKKEEEEPKINPRWEIINELYDAIDNDMVNLSNKHGMKRWRQ